MDFKELETQIKELIAKDDIETAIKLLSKYFQNDPRLDEILLQSGQYHALLKDKVRGTIDYEEVTRMSNKLRANILSFIRSEAEESKFKEKVFQSEDGPAADDHNNIDVFLSVGSPHREEQVEYIEKLKDHLLKYNIELKTLDGDDWDNLDPLNPIRRQMASCHGCLVLAMERFHVKEGLVKRGSQQEKVVQERNYATPWSHIEATLAYQLQLPFIILKEKTLMGEGMLDDNLFEWRIVQVDPQNPEELDQYPIKSFIRMWVEEVRKVAGR